MTDPVQIIRELGGGARWKTLMLAGISRAALAHDVEAKRIINYGSGVYGLPGMSTARFQMLRGNAESACFTAAKERGFWVLKQPNQPHVSANNNKKLIGFVKHRAKLPLSDIDVVLQVLRCAPRSSVRRPSNSGQQPGQASHRAAFDEITELDAIVVVTSAIRMKRCTLNELNERLSRRTDVRARELLKRIDPHAESPLEVASRFHLENAGFVVTSQVYLPGMGRMDQCINGVLALELMGKEFHLAEQSFNEDLRRFNQYTVAGFPVLRVGYAQVVHHPTEFVDLVRRAMSAL
ncbi:hypothetical protein [Psychromicrobium lacuslunae]|nr:hypothetical protein [Psychromicrobium lacuslunae]